MTLNYRMVITLIDQITGEPLHSVDETDCAHCIVALMQELTEAGEPFLITVAAEPAVDTNSLIENGPTSKEDIH